MSEEKADRIEGSDNQNPAQSLPPPVSSEPNQIPANGYEAHGRREKESCLEVTRLVVEIITLGVLFWYAWTTQAQLNEARRANNTAWEALESVKENSRLDQRAWVVVSAIWLTKFPIAKQQMRFIVEIQNTGGTPGLKVVRRIQFNVSQPSNLEAFWNISDRSGSVVVPPGAGVYNSLFDVLEEEAPTEMQIADVINGNSSLYLYGIVDYEDIFGGKHFTRFCGRYGIDRNLPPPPSRVSLLLKFCENDDYNYME